MVPWSHWICLILFELEEEDAMYGLDEEDEDAEKENTRRMAPGTDLGDDDVNRLLKTAFTNKQRNTFLQQVPV